MKNQVQQLLSLGSIYFIGGIIEKGFGFLLIPISTFFISPEDYGAIGLMLLVVNLTGVFIMVPVNSGVFRFYYLLENAGKRKIAIFSGFTFISFQAIIIGGLFFFFNTSISRLFLDNSKYSPVVIVFSAIIFFQPIKTYFLSLLQIQKRALLFISVSISRMLIFIGVVFLLLKYYNMGFMGLAYGYLVFSAYDVIIIFPFMIKHMSFRFDLGSLKPLLAYGYPLVFSALSMFLFQFGDRFVLRIFCPLSAVGLLMFAANFQIIFFTLIYEPSKKALNPVIFENEKNPDQVKRLLITSANYLCIISFGIWLIVSLFSKEIVHLMGRNAEYWKAWPLVPVVSLSGVLFGLNDLASKGIAMANKTALIMKISLGCCILNIVLNFIFVPVWGVMGAAITTCMSFFVMIILKSYFSYRTYDIILDWKTISITTLSAVLIYSTGLLTMLFPFYMSIVVKTALIFCFPLALWITKVITSKDIAKWRNIFYHQGKTMSA